MLRILYLLAVLIIGLSITNILRADPDARVSGSKVHVEVTSTGLPCDSISVTSDSCHKIIPIECKINGMDYFLKQVVTGEVNLGIDPLIIWNEIKNGIVIVPQGGIDRLNHFEFELLVITGMDNPVVVTCYNDGRQVDNFLVKIQEKN